jgi:hypothetical protein
MLRALLARAQGGVLTRQNGVEVGVSWLQSSVILATPNNDLRASKPSSSTTLPKLNSKIRKILINTGGRKASGAKEYWLEAPPWPQSVPEINNDQGRTLTLDPQVLIYHGWEAGGLWIYQYIDRELSGRSGRPQIPAYDILVPYLQRCGQDK